MADLDLLAVENFREYLRIKSVHPDIDYVPCIGFLSKLANEIQLPFNVYEFVPKKPVMVMTWAGSEPILPTILLNSHMDVVPVSAELWTHDPFTADMDANGDIYARGSQDMKCVGVQYLEAIRRLKQQGVIPCRTVHLSFVPDEEIGGGDGMEVFIQTQQFKDLNVGFALDEGMASESETFWIFYGERTIWQMTLQCNGRAGHGSLLIAGTAGEKLRVIIDRFMDKRQQELDKLLADPTLTTGDVTTINLTMVQGGLQANVVPSQLSVTFDTRIAQDVDLEQFEETVRGWIEEAGGDVDLNFIVKNTYIPSTDIGPNNIYWTAMKNAFDDMGVTLHAVLNPGTTDTNKLRKIGLPAIGFSPMNNTLVRLHDNDEFLNKDVFLRGINIYMELIPALAAAS